MLSDEDVQRIAENLAPRLVREVRADHHDFWIDPETHYQDHISWRALSPDDIHSLKDLIQLFKATRGLAFKAFLGFAVVGAVIMAAVGIGFKY